MGLEETKSVSGNGVGEISSVDVKKCCSDCKTTETPLWRGGPAGPKSLCNACGIRHRKKRGVISVSDKKREGAAAASASTATSASSGSEGGDQKVRLKIVFRRSAIVKKKQRCQRRRRMIFFGEEEQAAFCLMALSCGSVSVFSQV